MAGNDWIKVRTKLPKDGRLKIASRKCHATTVTALGALVTLWSFGDDHAESDGTLLGYTADDVNEMVGVPGFAEALPTDWIDLSGEWVKLPEYQEHNGTTAKARAQTTRRKQKSRTVTPATDESRRERDKNVTREEKRREEHIKASARTADASTSEVLVTDGDGKPITSPIANLTAEQSAVVVKSCLALRKMGAIRWHPGDEGLAALALEGFTAEQIVRCAGEKTLRDAGLLNDPDVRVDLLDLLINGAKQQDMGLTDEQHLAVRSAVTQVSINFITATLRGRRSDAHAPPAKNGAAKRKPSATDNFEGKKYVGTAIENIHPSLRPTGEEHV